MNLRFDNDKNIAYIVPSGPLSKEAILEAFGAVVADDGYGAGMGRLWDFREADLLSLDLATLTAMAQFSLSLPAGMNDVKVALVISGDLDPELSRMLELASMAQPPVNVFHAMDEAEGWMTE